jgi:hypothetical protein
LNFIILAPCIYQYFWSTNTQWYFPPLLQTVVIHTPKTPHSHSHTIPIKCNTTIDQMYLIKGRYPVSTTVHTMPTRGLLHSLLPSLVSVHVCMYHIIYNKNKYFEFYFAFMIFLPIHLNVSHARRCGGFTHLSTHKIHDHISV